jgi:3-oxoacyl-[acyl-carrier protein] reductase
MGVLPDRLDAAVAVAASVGDGDRCHALPVDVRDPDSVDEFARAVRSRIGLVTILVNNAGVDRMTPFLDIDDAEWRWMVETHLYGTFHCARAFLADMVAEGQGCVVNITSELALIGRTRQVHYVAAKAGIIGLTKALAREFAPKGIRINAVAPGPTLTDMLTDHERRQAEKALPLGRVGRPSDIAAAVAFLCSDESSWTTGQVLSPNGGAVI